MWFFLISSIAWSIVGNATDSWFADTRLGIWFYKKTDELSIWATNKLNINILKEEKKWKKKYPNISKDMDNLSKRIKFLENIHMDDGK